MQKTEHKSGFTLLELLMAISIFAMVIGLAYASYNASFTIISDATASNDTYTKARTAMERILDDLESLYVGEEMVFTGTSGSNSDYRADTMEFSSTAYVRLHPDDASPGSLLIRYEIREEGDTGLISLYRSQEVKTTQEDDKKQQSNSLLLCDGLKEVAIDYRNNTGEMEESWGIDEAVTSAEALPALISISLRFADNTLFQTSLTPPMAKKK